MKYAPSTTLKKWAQRKGAELDAVLRTLPANQAARHVSMRGMLSILQGVLHNDPVSTEVICLISPEARSAQAGQDELVKTPTSPKGGPNLPPDPLARVPNPIGELRVLVER